jgi:hypothetical protein
MKASARPPILDLLRQWGTLVAILGTFLVNVWSNLFPLNELSIGEIANTLFRGVQIIPANYAFSIWGVIYLGLLAYGAFQLLPSQRQNPTLRRVDYLLIISCVVQALWVITFLLRQFWVSTLMMVGILLPLIGIYLQLGVGRRRVSRREKWCAHIPFSIYLGWISVATIVNVAVALYNDNWDGWGIAPQAWTAIMMSVAALVAALVAISRRDIAFPLVIVWALLAVAIRQVTLPFIATIAIGLAVIVTLVVLLVQFRPSRFA